MERRPPRAARFPYSTLFRSPKTFVPADFARFAPRNALDMLRNVPGFTIREAAQERGLGTATGNVLINAQRISGKSKDRKSTRLNSSHANISYAVFCLKQTIR